MRNLLVLVAILAAVGCASSSREPEKTSETSSHMDRNDDSTSDDDDDTSLAEKEKENGDYEIYHSKSDDSPDEKVVTPTRPSMQRDQDDPCDTDLDCKSGVCRMHRDGGWCD